MGKKIILKSTDYVKYEGEPLAYSYPYKEQYDDGKALNELSKKELMQCCNGRWTTFKNYPCPSNYSKFKLAEDLAKAKGLTPTYYANQKQENQREF